MSSSVTGITPSKVFAATASSGVQAVSAGGTTVNVAVTLLGAQIRASGATPPVAVDGAPFTVTAKLDEPLAVHLANANAKSTLDASPVMKAIVAHVANANGRPKLIALATLILSDAGAPNAGSFGINPPIGPPVRLFLRSESDASVYFPAKLVDKKLVPDQSAPIAVG